MFWALGKKWCTNMGNLWISEEFSREYKRWLHERETIDDFNNKWKELKEQFHLEGSGLGNMYEKQKEHWALIYLKILSLL